jgi:hypothetical protein
LTMVSEEVSFYSSLMLFLILFSCVIDKIRLAEERKELEHEVKELKDTGGPRVRKGDVEELRRKAARLGKVSRL